MKDYIDLIKDLKDIEKPLGYLLLIFSFFYLILEKEHTRLGFYTLIYASANLTFRLFWKDSRTYIFNKKDKKEPNWLYHSIQAAMLIIWIWAILVFTNL